jgi:hypothetical protein
MNGVASQTRRRERAAVTGVLAREPRQRSGIAWAADSAARQVGTTLGVAPLIAVLAEALALMPTAIIDAAQGVTA